MNKVQCKKEKINYIYCQGKNKSVEKFKYKVEFNPIEDYWIFRVYSLKTQTQEFFEFQVAKIDDKTAKVIMMSHQHDFAYIAKGIPEKMIEEANKVLKLDIISSSLSSKHRIFKNEWIIESAVKVWKRLEEKGKAIFDKENKVFRYKP